MTNAFAEFHFLRPWWLLALLLAPALWYALRAAGASRAAWQRAVDAHLLDHVLAGSDTTPRWPIAVALAAFVIATLALAGPAWERLPTPLLRNQAARVIALELSTSMLAADLKPDRLSRARYKIRDLLRRSGDGQTALLGYAGDAFVVAPLTDDANTVENLIDALTPDVMPVPGNATERAIERGAALLAQAGLSGGDVILVADSVSPGAADAARAARKRGVRVSVLAVGTDAGAPVSLPQGGFLKDAAGNIVVPKLDAAALRAVAEAGDGHYVELASDERDLDALRIGARVDAALPPAGADDAQTAAWRDRGPWLCLLLLPLAAVGFRRGWLLVLLLAALPAQRASALEWKDLWQRRDQQAWNALQAKDSKQAQALATEPPLHGAAAYRNEDYAAATQDFARGADADAAYNRGNALAKQQKFEDAIAAYDEALQRDPNHADALANRKAVEEWMKQQKQQNSQNGKDQDHQGGEQSPDQANNSGEKSSKDGQRESREGGQKDSESGEKKQDSSAQEKQDASKQQGNGAGKQPQADDVQANDDPAKSEKEQKFRQAMNQALDSKDGREGAQASAKPSETEPQRERRQAQEQLLQRVPDDPGGLLRLKFQLEYERRRARAAHEGDH